MLGILQVVLIILSFPFRMKGIDNMSINYESLYTETMVLYLSEKWFQNTVKLYHRILAILSSAVKFS